MTKPIGYKVVRKLADFLFLNEIMPLYNNVVFNPPLPHFEFGLKDDSGKKMLYLQNYINSLIENKFFRTLPIFYEFLSLPQVKWNNKRNELAKMKQLPLTRMPFLEGELNININKEEDAKAFKIKDEINKKTEALDGVNSTMDKILEIFDNLKYQFEMLAKFLLDLEKAYQSNQELKGFFNRLKLLSKRWSKDYLKQKIVFRDEFKYYFKFINKDNVSFLKKFEEYRVARDDYNIPSLLLIPCFIVDFLSIHPFSDGNGRVSRLLTLLLLYKEGYDIGKYISLENQINNYKERYYEVLQRCQNQWHESKNTYYPFIEFMFQILYQCYKEINKRFIITKSGKAKKSERIETVVLDSIVPISKADIMELLPDVSVTTVEVVLARLIKENKISKIGTYKDAKYIKRR